MGLKSGHIVPDIQAIIIFVFVITSISSTYMIKYNQQLQGFLSKFVERIGFKDLENAAADEPAAPPKEIALLGFFRVASSFIREIEDADEVGLKDKIVVVDFNPQVLRRLPRHGIKVVYGDVSNPETLHHAGIGGAKIVISTISDEILVGTDNLRLIDRLQKIAPEARIIVTAETPSRALTLYDAGADYVYLPNELAAKHLLTVVERLLRGKHVILKEEELERLRKRNEVIS
jgi:hypothetical protein